jgi:hypothetical protein
MRPYKVNDAGLTVLMVRCFMGFIPGRVYLHACSRLMKNDLQAAQAASQPQLAYEIWQTEQHLKDRAPSDTFHSVQDPKGAVSGSSSDKAAMGGDSTRGRPDGAGKAGHVRLHRGPPPDALLGNEAKLLAAGSEQDSIGAHSQVLAPASSGNIEVGEGNRLVDTIKRDQAQDTAQKLGSKGSPLGFMWGEGRSKEGTGAEATQEQSSERSAAPEVSVGNSGQVQGVAVDGGVIQGELTCDPASEGAAIAAKKALDTDEDIAAAAAPDREESVMRQLFEEQDASRQHILPEVSVQRPPGAVDPSILFKPPPDPCERASLASAAAAAAVKASEASSAHSAASCRAASESAAAANAATRAVTAARRAAESNAEQDLERALARVRAAEARAKEAEAAAAAHSAASNAMNSIVQEQVRKPVFVLNGASHHLECGLCSR